MRRNPQSLLNAPAKAAAPPQAPTKPKKGDDRADRHIWERGQSSAWKVTSDGGIITATLPYPLSGNDCMRYTIIKGHAHSYPSAAFKAYRGLIDDLFNAGMVGPTTQPVEFIATLYRPQAAGDLDNRIKALWDSLNGNAWKDDGQVRRLVVDLEEDRANPRVEVEIRPHAAKSNGVLEF